MLPFFSANIFFNGISKINEGDMSEKFEQKEKLFPE